jgi:hypothetical protein
MPDAMGKLFNKPINAKRDKKGSDYKAGSKVKKDSKVDIRKVTKRLIKEKMTGIKTY